MTQTYTLQRMGLGVYGDLPRRVLTHAVFGYNSNFSSKPRCDVHFFTLNENSEVCLEYHLFCYRSNRFVTSKHLANCILYMMKSILRGCGQQVSAADLPQMSDIEMTSGSFDLSGEYGWEKVPELTVKLSRLRALQMVFLGKSSEQIVKQCGEDAYNEAVGRPSNPFISAQKQAILQQIKDLQKETLEKNSALEALYKPQINELQRKFDEEQKQLVDFMEAKRKELLKRFNELQ